MAFEDLFLRYVAVGFDRQLALAEQIGSWAWSLDAEGGTITFTKKKLFTGTTRTSAVQFLGSEAKAEKTWLWSWANESLPQGGKAMAAARRLRDIGEEEGVPEFVEPGFPLGKLDGHRIAVTVAAMFGVPYYRCSHEGGAFYALLEDESFREDNTKNRVARVTSVFSQVISAMTVSNHRRAFEAYVESYGFALTSEGDRVVAKADEGTVSGQFDAQNRLVKLSADAVAKA